MGWYGSLHDLITNYPLGMLSYVNEAEAQTNIKRHGTGYARTSSSRLHTDKDLSVVSRRTQILAFFHSANQAGTQILGIFA